MRVYAFRVEHALLIGAVGVTDQQHGEIMILCVLPRTIGETIEKRGQLGDDFGVQLGDALAELWAPECRDPDLGEQKASLTIGRKLEQQKVESACECALGIEHVQLRHQRRAEVFDDLIDRCDEQGFLGLEVVVDETGRHAGVFRNALHRRVGEAVLDDGGAESVDDLAPTGLRKTRPSHRLIG